MKTKKIPKKVEQTSVTPEYMVHQLNNDVRNAVLVVSLMVNVFMLTSWLVIMVSNRYDVALISYLLNR